MSKHFVGVSSKPMTPGSMTHIGIIDAAMKREHPQRRKFVHQRRWTRKHQPLRW